MYFGEARYFNITRCMAPCNYYYYSTKQVYFDCLSNFSNHSHPNNTFRICFNKRK